MCVCRICSVTFMFVALYVCVICNPLLVYLSVLCNLPVLPICEVVLCIIPARNFFLVFIVCLSVVSRWAHADYLRDCIVHCDTHTHTHTMQGGEPRRSWFRCPSLTCSVQDFLQDVATEPVPDSFSLSSFLSLHFLLVSLSFGKARERERSLLLI